VEAVAARPAIVATATTICGKTMTHTAHARGPGNRANPCSTVAPVQTAYRPISRLMNHLSATAAISAQSST
jgi:hypothetical protein